MSARPRRWYCRVAVLNPINRHPRCTLAWCASTNHPTAARFAMGLPLFSHHRFQRLDVERLLGDDEFQPAVLILELLEPLHLAELDAAERFPAIVRLPRDPVRPTKIGHLPPSFAFLDDARICSALNLLRFIGPPFNGGPHSTRGGSERAGQSDAQTGKNDRVF